MKDDTDSIAILEEPNYLEGVDKVNIPVAFSWSSTTSNSTRWAENLRVKILESSNDKTSHSSS